MLIRYLIGLNVWVAIGQLNDQLNDYNSKLFTYSKWFSFHIWSIKYIQFSVFFFLFFRIWVYETRFIKRYSTRKNSIQQKKNQYKQEQIPVGRYEDEMKIKRFNLMLWRVLLWQNISNRWKILINNLQIFQSKWILLQI